MAKESAKLSYEIFDQKGALKILCSFLTVLLSKIISRSLDFTDVSKNFSHQNKMKLNKCPAKGKNEKRKAKDGKGRTRKKKVCLKVEIFKLGTKVKTSLNL